MIHLFVKAKVSYIHTRTQQSVICLGVKYLHGMNLRNLDSKLDPFVDNLVFPERQSLEMLLSLWMNNQYKSILSQIINLYSLFLQNPFPSFHLYLVSK